jgi:hypothetical protein
VIGDTAGKKKSVARRSTGLDYSSHITGAIKWGDAYFAIPAAQTPERSHSLAAPVVSIAAATSTTSAAPAIAPLDRWRLVLGRERECLGPTPSRAAVALDELYGHGRGEGSAAAGLGQGDRGRRGGQEAPFPTAREWADELQALFGGRVRDEVLARAAARGRADALLAVDPDAVVASVDLLEQVLSLHGALPEARLGQLRRLVDRIVAELVRELARRLRPALVGLAVPRPTRRPGGPLDLDRAVRANLHTAGGVPTTAPCSCPSGRGSAPGPAAPPTGM